MTSIASALIEELELAGIEVDSDRGDIVLSRRPPAELRSLLVQYKPEVLRELRRRQALAMLRDDPGLQRAFVVVDDGDPERVLVMTAVRGAGSCNIEVPRASWDPFLFLAFMEGRLQ